mgnify:CR=1 FL=1
MCFHEVFYVFLFVCIFYTIVHILILNSPGHRPIGVLDPLTCLKIPVFLSRCFFTGILKPFFLILVFYLPIYARGAALGDGRSANLPAGQKPIFADF